MLDKGQRIKDPGALKKAQKEECEYCLGHTRIGGDNIGHVHHIKSKGSGGHDVPGNLIYLCYRCHEWVHKGLISRETLKKIVEEADKCQEGDK